MRDPAARVENEGVCTTTGGVIECVLKVEGIGILVCERGCPIREATETPGGVYLLNNGSGVHFDICVRNRGYDPSLTERQETVRDEPCSIQATSGWRRRALRASVDSVPAIPLNTSLLHLSLSDWLASSSRVTP